jgi:hypothetical protein
VVYANGDVGVCELHQPLGNLRQKTFWEIWSSPEAGRLRASIAAKECHCTTEVFLWSSIVYQPQHLARAALAARVWERPEPLAPGELAAAAGRPARPLEAEGLIGIGDIGEPSPRGPGRG